LTESVLLPSSTLARDYEAHVIETRDGAAVTGVIRGHVAEGLLVVDLAGQEQVVAHDRIVSDTRLEQSLMPVGLDAAFSESEFADLLAWLSSLR
jgi:putative heme-binding domain-containing protein